MKKAIENLKKTKEFHCGFSGTAFRFLTLRMSRETGDFLFTGKESLLNRPLQEISTLLSQLSVEVEKTDQGFFISSKGWKAQGDQVYIPSSKTSQWGSALVLNSWNLKHDLYFVMGKNAVSYPYFQMSLDFVRKLGLIVKENGQEFFIPKNQSLKKRDCILEQDKSCLFVLACFAVLKGQSVFLDWEEESLQADHIFPKVLEEMGVPIEYKNNQLWVSQCKDLKPLHFNLRNCPDLFPLLSVLCAKAEGLSELRGLSHQVFKESNRMKKIVELLRYCGISIEYQQGDICRIYGQKTWEKVSPFVFDTAHDHRLVMAGELLAAINIPITLQGKNIVNKSFPEFYERIYTFT